MNFSRMPEVHARWGYPVVIAVMGGIAVGMLVWFRRKGWLFRGGDRRRPRDPRRDR